MTQSCCAPSNDGRGSGDVRCTDSPLAVARLRSQKECEFRSIPAGRYRIGYEGLLAHPADGEGPVREIELPAFRIASTAVTNAQFAEFTDATGYVTDAEKAGSSFVFHLLLDEASRAHHESPSGLHWWRIVKGACWNSPEGPGSTIEERLEHPVVHVSFRDAVAYAKWIDARLPTEAEWEVAARGGLCDALYPWGNDLTPEGTWRCNIWQGAFPDSNDVGDGYLGTAPVRSFEPNGYGLYEMCGNVWEWVAGSWSGRDHACVRRGGSYLCHDSYCNRYRVSARSRGLPGDTSGNTGMRVVMDALAKS